MSQKRRSVLITALLLGGVSCPALLRAQSVEGRVNGAITDPTGKMVPGAQVVLKSLDTNAERTTSASDTGTFVIPSLPPGRYSATVSSAGFQQYVIPEFRLQVNESRSFDIRLTVGQVNQTVEVQAAAAALNTTDATIGTVIQHENIVEIPLNGRNFTQLI